MRDLVKKLWEVVEKLGIPFVNLVSILQRLLQLGLPPDVNEEAALKIWIQRLLATFNDIAITTPSAIDDKVVLFLSKAVNDEETWAVIYNLMKLLLSRSPQEFAAVSYGDGLPVNDEVELSVVLAQKMARKGEIASSFDPVTILSIITTLVEIYKLLKTCS